MHTAADGPDPGAPVTASFSLSIAVEGVPLAPLTYTSPDALHRGDWVVVPLGRAERLGLVVDAAAQPRSDAKPIIAASPMAPLIEADLALLEFAARYTHHSVGQAIAAAVSPVLREPERHRERRTPKGRQQPAWVIAAAEADAEAVSSTDSTPDAEGDRLSSALPAPTADQQRALQEIRHHWPQPVHLWGITGSGKTRVYQALLAEILAQNPQAQVLVLVPEIGLTPQLARRLAEAFPYEPMAVLHSGLPEVARARATLAAMQGRARIVLGTRLATLTPMPHLAAIVMDEEHDASYKQQEGLKYHARDLALWRARQRGVPLLMGSATPSLEAWALIDEGRLARVDLHQRATGQPLPEIRLIDMRSAPAQQGVATAALAQLDATLAAGQQALVFLNRRGWAPVLGCEACGWFDGCGQCSVGRVLHRGASGQWRCACHHCGAESAPPRRCPDCGATDLQPMGRGLQQVETDLAARWPHIRSIRLDRDAMKSSKALAQALDDIRDGRVQLVFATQMVAKGHDFPGLQTVLVLNADTQLANPEFRAPEQLFSLLLQVAGRAGRHGGSAIAPTVTIQTRQPEHPIFQTLLQATPKAHERLLRSMLDERRMAGLPPHRHIAAVRISHANEARAQQMADDLCAMLRATIESRGMAGLQVLPPMRRHPERVAGKLRLQILLESDRRAPLHEALAWLGRAELWAEWTEGRRMEISMEVDPLTLT